jgi:hypothetical protein
MSIEYLRELDRHQTSSCFFLHQVFPLWTMTDPKEGGLGFTTDEIGELLGPLPGWDGMTVQLSFYSLFFFTHLSGITSSVGSLSIVLIQLGLYGPLAKRLGTGTTSRNTAAKITS